MVFAVQRIHQYHYGRIFTLITDHWCLCIILGEKEGISPLAAVSMQRWELLLSAYQYIQSTTHPWHTKQSCRLHIQATKFVREV